MAISTKTYCQIARNGDLPSMLKPCIDCDHGPCLVGKDIAPQATHFIQPKITGYRQLSPKETDLMNEAKALAEQCRVYVEKLRSMPATHANGLPHVTLMGEPSIDQRWVSIGATQLQQGFMAVVRGIAQPSTF